MASLVEDRMAVARAAVATTIAARTGMRLAGASSGGVHTGDDLFLTLCSTPPAGYHMEAELVPLEIIMRNVEGLQSGDGVDPREMTTADHFLEEINAFVHNRLLNPALPLAPQTPGITDCETIDDVYGSVLENATFAGSVAPDSSRYKEASQLLFTDGAASPALETYRAYETRAQDARDAVTAIAADDTEGRDLAGQRLHRIEAEWIGLGKKLEIEEAFRTLQAETESAGFQDERVSWLEQFRAGEEKRIDLPGMTYHRVQIVPISPLLDDTNTFWQHVEMDADVVSANLTADARAALSLNDGQVTRATDRLQVLAFDYVVCDLIREWINTAVFNVDFWRMDHDAPPLSDGAGGGRLPTLPTRAIFIRGARVAYEGERSANPGTLADQPSITGSTIMATLQITPEVQPAAADKTSKILEAAKRRGLTSSVALLRKESTRTSQKSIRKAVAFAPGINAALSTAAARLQPAAARVSARAFAPPRAFGRIARKAEIVAGRSTSRVPSRPDTVRDRRRRAAKPPRRSTRSRDDRVRDHRSPRISITLTIDGMIEAAADQKDELEGLSLTYLRVGEDDERAIRLARATPTRLTFRQQLGGVVRQGQSVGYHLVLRDRDGNELDRRLVEAEDDEDFTLNWVVQVERVEIELAGQLTPTLHAYGLRIIPPCPTPDEDLTWP